MDTSKKIVVRCRGIIVDDGALLVVYHTGDTTFCALPGGHLEWGENVQGCIAREIYEELGVVPVIGRLLYVNTFTDPKDGTQSVEFFFEVTNGEAFKKNVDVSPSHAHEIARIAWVRKGDDVPLRPAFVLDDLNSGTLISSELRFTNS